MSTKLRAACDNCHRAKVRCSGQLPCQGCLNTGTLCFFSLSDRLGRPKGTKNRSPEESRKRSNTGKAAATARRANNNKGTAPITNNKDSAMNFQPTTTATISPNTTPDSNDHDLNGSSSEDSYKERFDYLDSQNNQAPFDGSLHITPNDSDFSNLLWTDTDVNFMHAVGLSHDNEVILDSISAPSTAPPMETLLGKQAASTATSSCACMQQQVDLLFKSKILNNSQPTNNNDYNNDRSVVSIDVALGLVEEGMKTWQTPIMCASCRCNDDQEVILLAFMSIQAIARYFQRLLIRNRAQLNGTTPPNHTDPSQCPRNTRLTIGTFQVQGEDRLLLLKTLVLNTVRKLRWILTSLQKILEEKIARFPPHETAAGDTTHSQLHGDVFYIQHMFHGLASSLQSIQESLSHP